MSPHFSRHQNRRSFSINRRFTAWNSPERFDVTFPEIRFFAKIVPDMIWYSHRSNSLVLGRNDKISLALNFLDHKQTKNFTRRSFKLPSCLGCSDYPINFKKITNIHVVYQSVNISTGKANSPFFKAANNWNFSLSTSIAEADGISSKQNTDP